MDEPVKKRILVVDDDKAILELLRHKLLRQGYDVTTAKNEEEFRGNIVLSKPNLILLDIWLKNKSGADIYNDLLRSGFDRDVPVIFITALDDIPPKHAPPGGKYALYCKPFNFDELTKEIEELVRLS